MMPLSESRPAALQIVTPEGVSFRLPLAGLVSRGLAALLDMVVVLVAASSIQVVAKMLSIIHADLGEAVSTFLLFLLNLLYGILLEWFWRGQTVGKRVCRLRVMDEQGLRLRFSRVAMRNLLRLVDILPFFYLTGAVAAFCSRNSQRLGDKLAGTVVVRVEQPADPDLSNILAGKFNSLRQHTQLAARLRQSTQPAEAQLVLQALLRRNELDPDSRIVLFRELAGLFRQKVIFPAETLAGLPDEQYLRDIVDLLFHEPAFARKVE